VGVAVKVGVIILVGDEVADGGGGAVAVSVPVGGRVRVKVGCRCVGARDVPVERALTFAPCSQALEIKLNIKNNNRYRRIRKEKISVSIIKPEIK
jgi:hypothetical protein